MKAGESLGSLNTLIYQVCRGPAYKSGATIVSGILHALPVIPVIAAIGMPVRCFEKSETRVKSRVFDGFDTFRMPSPPKNASYYVNHEGTIHNVGIWFLFDTVPICCGSFVDSAIIVGTEALLREALQGKHYIPRAYFAEYAAMELTTDDTSH